MKTALIIGIAFSMTLGVNASLAQTHSQDETTVACGKADTTFSVHFEKNRFASRVSDSQNATVYVIEQFVSNDKGHFGRPTIRQGLDGQWIGATQGLSYVAALVAPGAHHLCSQVQSHTKKLSSMISLNNFIAEANHSYYFRSQIHTDSTPLALEQVSEDEGKYLLSEAPLSKSIAQ